MPHTPESAQEALDRDLELAADHVDPVREAFRRERDRLAAKPNDDPVREREWVTVLAALWLTAGRQVYPSTVKALASAVTPGPVPVFPNFVQAAADGISRLTRKRIKAIRATKPRNLSRQLRKLYQTDFVKKRAVRIALDQALRQTATYEHAAAERVQAATGDDVLKVWHNQGDNRVRGSHLSITAVMLDDLFIVGGAELRYPRDPAGPGSETFGCRCWVEHQIGDVL